MVANAVFNAYILWKFPDFETIQRNDAQSDIKDFLASNPAFAKQVVTTGVDIMRSNPELARQGAEAVFTSTMSQPQPRTNSSGYSPVGSDPNYASV
jgi:hypothetical protein